MTIKTREPDERFKAQVPDFKLEKRSRPKYRTWRDDPDEAPKAVETQPQVEPEPKADAVESTPKPVYSEPKNGQITVSELPDNDQTTVSKQTDNGQIMTKEQPENGQIKSSASEERSDKASENGKRTVSKRSDNSKRTVRPEVPKGLTYSSLVGLQKLLVDYYYESIQANGGETTHEVRSKDLQALFGSDPRTVIDANYQLTKKGVIYRAEYKDGRAGWTKFGIEKSIKEQIHRLLMVRERSDNGKSTVRELSSERSDKRSDDLSSSSSNSSFITQDSKESLNPSPKTTTTEQGTDYGWISRIDLPNELAQIVTESHLRQLARHGFTSADADLVQASLDNMAHAINIGQKYNKPASVFLAVMKREGFFSPVESFSFDRERARRLMEADKAKIEEAVQQEITRLAHERLDEAGRGSLDVIPF